MRVAGAMRLILPPPGLINQFYSSSDGGQTWVAGDLLEETYDVQGDPAVTFCADGTAYFAALSITSPGGGSGVFVYRSTDGGLSWPTKSTVANIPSFPPRLDKPWIACDKH